MCVNTLEQTFFRMVRDIFFVFLLANILFSYENKVSNAQLVLCKHSKPLYKAFEN